MPIPVEPDTGSIKALDDSDGSMGRAEADEGKRWLTVLIPFNAAVQALSTYVPLQILALGGDVVQVGFAAVVYNLALIPAPLLWGYVCDATGRRRQIIISSSILLLVASLGFFVSYSIFEVIILYAAVAHAVGMLSP